MQMISQQSDRDRVWYEPVIMEPAPGTLSVPAGFCWVQGVAYALPAYAPLVGTAPFWLWIERTSSTQADYYLDWTGEGVPASFGPGIGGLLVAWRDGPGLEVHVLRHEEAR